MSEELQVWPGYWKMDSNKFIFNQTPEHTNCPNGGTECCHYPNCNEHPIYCYSEDCDG